MQPQRRAIYSGEYRHMIDDKNRVTIPSNWRSTHPEGAQFLATRHNGGLLILSPAKTAHLLEQADNVPSNNTEVQLALERFFAKSNTFCFDKQGRMPLIEAHRIYANINKEVVLAGAGANFVIYNPENWSKVLGENETDQAKKDQEKKDAEILSAFGI